MLLAEAGADAGKTAAQAFLLVAAGLIGAVVVKVLDIWNAGRTNRFQQNAEHAKWLRERRQQTFDAVAAMLAAGPQSGNVPELRKYIALFQERSASLSWLDENGWLFSLATEYADALTEAVTELDAMNPSNSTDEEYSTTLQKHLATARVRAHSLLGAMRSTMQEANSAARQ